MKNMQRFPFLYLPMMGLSLTILGNPLAQEADPLWQVINDSPTQVIPLYMGQPSPFPSSAPEEEEKVEEISAEDLLKMEQAKHAAELKAEIQAQINQPSALLPDVSNLMAQAYLKGMRGDMALIGGRWYDKKTSFEVPTYKNPNILSKIKTLYTLNEGFAQEVEAALYAKNTQTPKMKLQIEKIDAKEVVFQGPQGKIVLPVRQNSSQW